MEENKSAQNWKEVLLGGIPGILLGAGGVLTAQAFTPAPTPDETDIPVAHSVNNDMSFGQAFAAAREEVGPGGAFTWHGNVYSTYRSDDPEWIEMGPEGQAEHCHDIIVQVHVEPYIEPIIEVVPGEIVPEYGAPIPDDMIDDDIIDIEGEVYGPDPDLSPMDETPDVFPMDETQDFSPMDDAGMDIPDPMV